MHPKSRICRQVSLRVERYEDSILTRVHQRRRGMAYEDDNQESKRYGEAHTVDRDQLRVAYLFKGVEAATEAMHHLKKAEAR